MITPAQLAEIVKKAKAAQSLIGKLKEAFGGCDWFAGEEAKSVLPHGADLDFVRVATPDVVLALCEEVERLHDEAGSLRRVLGWSIRNGPCSEVSIHAAMIAAQRDAVTARAEVAALKERAEAAEINLKQWDEDCGKLGKDLAEAVAALRSVMRYAGTTGGATGDAHRAYKAADAILAKHPEVE